jgi:hypothetical protein
VPQVVAGEVDPGAHPEPCGEVDCAPTPSAISSSAPIRANGIFMSRTVSRAKHDPSSTCQIYRMTRRPGKG